MNQENYCSLEAAQRLVDAGIVLETDSVWFRFTVGWQLIKKDSGYIYDERLPAPCFTEVWRELPFQSYIKMLDDGSSIAWICDEERDLISHECWSTNPADALAELLIWVKGQEAL